MAKLYAGPKRDHWRKLYRLGRYLLCRIDEFDLPWTCNRLGARGEYMFGKVAPVTGADANNAGVFELEQYIHLRMLNDGFLITPFHNMALMCTDTTAADVDAHTKAFHTMSAELINPA